jgi:hypothetical protein
MKRHLVRCAIALSFSVCLPAIGLAAGPDVIVGEVSNAMVVAREKGIASIAAATHSCNAGTEVLDWEKLPSNKHPVISLNFYRLKEGDFQQVGLSWVKHGFEALQYDVCNFGCKPLPKDREWGTALGVGCSDPYQGDIFRGTNLSKRSEVNPTTGNFDGLTAARTMMSPVRSVVERGLLVKEEDLAFQDARYFIEAQYITADDALAGNSRNNVSYKEVDVRVNRRENKIDKIVISETGRDTKRGEPAISAWEADGAKLKPVEVVEATSGDREIKSLVIVGFKLVPVSGSRNRFIYAIYNMNSEQGIHSLRVPIGNTKILSQGFHAASAHGESWSNEEWPGNPENGNFVWATKKFSEDPDANAIRWGMTFTFWFEADATATPGSVSIGRFKAGKAPESETVDLFVPTQ